MSFFNWSRAQRAVVARSVLYAAVFVVMLILRPGSRTFYDAFFNTYQIFPPLFAGLCGVAYARHGRHLNASRQMGWLLIGAGCLSYAVGQSTWTYYESVRGVEVPFPGWADVGYLGVFPFLLSGVILLFNSTHVAGRARLLLADAFSAMTTTRPYRKGLDWEAALEGIRANSGTQFDPGLARAFLRAAAARRATLGGLSPVDGEEMRRAA